MAGICLITLLVMFISSRYFFHKARRDAESGIIIQMTLEHVLVQRFKKNKIDEDMNKRRHVYVAN